MNCNEEDDDEEESEEVWNQGCTKMEDMTSPLVKCEEEYPRYTDDHPMDIRAINTTTLDDELDSPSDIIPTNSDNSLAHCAGGRSAMGAGGKSFANLGFRLRERKLLIEKKRWIVDLEVGLALIGILIMVVDTELYFQSYYTIDSLPSQWLKLMVSISTVVLLFVVCMYYMVDMQLRMVELGLRSWRLAVSKGFVLKLLIEILICCVHPLPIHIGTLELKAPEKATRASHIVEDPLAAVLSILMFMRLYLIARFMVVHSNVLIDSAVQSLGTLSRVNINAQFVFRALMSTCPGGVLGIIMVSVFLIGSWTMRACETHSAPGSDTHTISQAMWLTAVTFLTLGYGDLTPSSRCGRFIAIWTGLMGVGITALCVAVLARKLEQTRPEKYVHTFLRRMRLDQRHKNAASDVLKQALMIWRLKRAGLPESNAQIMHHRRKLIDATAIMRSAKEVSSMVRENTVGIIEVANSVNEIYNLVKSIKDEQRVIQTRLSSLEVHIMGVNKQLQINKS
ncbi:small conductance calcium-activated potassium channel protein 2-like isoform X2 [Octopus sinensis]|uniref:Small conductance calcium-activated potassium channel protein 2-like isoform X2 n=1 Tax=Octopus sinensis TaxID=2607531 RepID=A0A7E6F7Y6_9MOLL|nr:small conductance calcium-activated potassium channel protein 2-like isoform X2 [Octopus sinensis]